MTPNRDLSELFRQQASKVQERPGPSVWRRLSRRLDTHERWNKVALRISTQVVLFFFVVARHCWPSPDWRFHRRTKTCRTAQSTGDFAGFIATRHLA